LKGNGREKPCPNVKVIFWHYLPRGTEDNHEELHCLVHSLSFYTLSILLQLPIPLCLLYVRGEEHEEAVHSFPRAPPEEMAVPLSGTRKAKSQHVQPW
jgi:hypothetical protein